MENYKDNIGNPLRKFIKENFRSMKECARRLSISPSLLSKIVNGQKKANRIIQHKFTELGFDETIFYNYLPVEIDETIDLNDFRYLLGSHLKLMNKMEMVLEFQEMQNVSLRLELNEKNQKITELKRHIDTIINNKLTRLEIDGN